ncbi:MAG: sugar ABC transporter permease [Anaerolineae bacterium]|nr:sugar ABC transporter permease [Anaerolineae bacterium]
MATTAYPSYARPVTARRRWSRLTVYLYLLPAVLFVGVFLLYPAIYTFYISLTKWNGLEAPQFVGLQNYVQFLEDPVFQTSFTNTVFWVIGTILLPVLWGLGMALLITRIKFEGVFKTIFYLPYAISATSTSVIWAFMLAPNGAINTFLHAVGLDAWARSWLISPPWHTIMMLVAYTWQTTGTNMVLFSVGLQAIPTDPVEAAKIDGANGWQSFRHVIFPLLRPITTVVVTLAVINSFKVFDLIWVMTQGGPYRSSETLVVTMYRESFVLFNLGNGAAIASLLSLIVFVFSAIYLRQMFRREY